MPLGHNVFTLIFDGDFLFMVKILSHLLILKCIYIYIYIYIYILYCTWLLNFDLDIIFAITVNRPILLFNTGTVQDRFLPHVHVSERTINTMYIYVCPDFAGWFCLFCKSVHDDCVKRYLLNIDNIALVVFAQSSNRLLFHTWYCVYKKVWHIYLWCNFHVLSLSYVVCGKVMFSVMSVCLSVFLFTVLRVFVVTWDPLIAMALCPTPSTWDPPAPAFPYLLHMGTPLTLAPTIWGPPDLVKLPHLGDPRTYTFRPSNERPFCCEINPSWR